MSLPIDHLPGWATRRCDDCDEMFLPGFGTVWSSREPDRHTHGGLEACRRQAAWVAAHPDGLAIIAKLMEQAIVEALLTLERFMSESDDGEWEPVASVILSAIDSLDRGYHARGLFREASRDPEDQKAAVTEQEETR